MKDLVQVECSVCKVGAPKIIEDELNEYLKQIPEWSVINTDSIEKIQRVFKFKNFGKALEFTVKVGELAEANGHHPAILTEWGKVTVTWWTHKIKGLHLNDLLMAKKTDRLL